MFLKNVKVLLCVVCIIEKSSTAGSGVISENKSVDIPVEIVETSTSEQIAKVDSTSTENINLDDKQWPIILFEKYDTDNDTFISPTELQQLIFNEFGGFLSISQATLYTRLLTLNDSDRMELKQFKEMKPIISLLKTRQRSEEKDNKNNTFTNETFLNDLMEKANSSEPVLNDNEILELKNLFDKNGKGPIESEVEFDKILNIFEHSNMVAYLHSLFRWIDTDNDGVIEAKELVKVLMGVHSEADAEEAYTVELATELITGGDLNGKYLRTTL